MGSLYLDLALLEQLSAGFTTTKDVVCCPQRWLLISSGKARPALPELPGELLRGHAADDHVRPTAAPLVRGRLLVEVVCDRRETTYLVSGGVVLRVQRRVQI